MFKSLFIVSGSLYTTVRLSIKGTVWPMKIIGIGKKLKSKVSDQNNETIQSSAKQRLKLE